MRRLPGIEADAFFHAVCEGSPVKGLRVNPLKAVSGGAEETKSLTALLQKTFPDMTPVAWEKNGYYISEEDKAGAHPLHAAGAYYVQEPSAMYPVTLLNVKPGEHVLDLCAAPGGKSTQIASYLNGEGVLVSNEIIPGRAKVLSENIERMGIANAVVTNETPERIAAFFPAYFDAVLVDAPCSGEGMFRKNPEAVKEWSEENVTMCAVRAASILEAADACVKPGGRIVFSTCTFSEEENEKQVEAFLARHPEYRLERKERIYPHMEQGEGHFAALLIKDGVLVKGAQAMRGVVKPPKGAPDVAFTAFLNEALTAEGRERLSTFTVVRNKDQIYAYPKDFPVTDTIKVLRQGLHLGTVKKERFDPAHALALFLSSRDVQYTLDLPATSEDVRRYLHGETLLAPEHLKDVKGYALLTCEGVSIAFARVAGGVLKNMYPKGLRR
ncbi:MAG: RsmF rRNA methyltransferase first C-terminal domain-containing protein [Lachnospiraceae bacterium]|nr:RsmF rRNA methyltransferase first C-terminal domain-containing protein [Lachnospiraceae bacterium]